LSITGSHAILIAARYTQHHSDSTHCAVYHSYVKAVQKKPIFEKSRTNVTVEFPSSRTVHVLDGEALNTKDIEDQVIMSVRLMRRMPTELVVNVSGDSL
jgi:hypothetical protein